MSNFFESGAGRVNGVFGSGMSLMFESSQDEDRQKSPSHTANQLMLEAVERSADESIRSMAAASVLEWARAGDSSYLAFDDYAVAMAGIEDDEDATDEQVDDYNQFLSLMANAAATFGASSTDIQAMIDDEDDTAAEAVAAYLYDLDQDEDDELITGFSLKSDQMLEAVKKVIRDGKVKLIKKPVRKRRLTAAQRGALKKARIKAHSASARVARAKSMKLRKRRGM